MINMPVNIGGDDQQKQNGGPTRCGMHKRRCWGSNSTENNTASATSTFANNPPPSSSKSSSKKYCKGTKQRREKFHTEHIVAKESDDHGDPGSDGWGLHIPPGGMIGEGEMEILITLQIKGGMNKKILCGELRALRPNSARYPLNIPASPPDTALQLLLLPPQNLLSQTHI